MTNYILIKELAPREDSKPYGIGTIAAATDGTINSVIKVWSWYENEDEARVAHSKLLFGDADE